MTRRLLAVLVAGALVAAPALASAQLSTSLSVAAGLAIPTGDLANGAKTGYNAAVGLDLGGPVIPFGVRLEGSYTSFDSKVSGGGSANLIAGIANAVLSLSPGIISPYVIGGVGFYSAGGSGCTGGCSRQTGAGANGGGGIKFGLGGLSTFAEIRYHVVRIQGSNTQFIPITFGVSF